MTEKELVEELAEAMHDERECRLMGDAVQWLWPDMPEDHVKNDWRQQARTVLAHLRAHPEAAGEIWPGKALVAHVVITDPPKMWNPAGVLDTKGKASLRPVPPCEGESEL